MNVASQQVSIQTGTAEDIPAMRRLFIGSVTEVCKRDYNGEQIRAWVSGVENTERWEKIIALQFVLIATYKNIMTGFCTLDGNHIDFFYVHKDYQGQGIARRLYADIEEQARHNGQTELTSDVSKTAKPFFSKMGFSVIKEQTVIRKGIELVNFKMAKKLAGL